MTRTERITFESKAEQLVGTLYLPDGAGKWPALVTDGPLTSVKEQATGNHARAMAERGFVALAFDHRLLWRERLGARRTWPEWWPLRRA